MRLTDKNAKKEGTTIGMPKAVACYWKLKDLEDIEELWGIDLNILFKAFNGLFYKKGNEIKFSCHIAVIDYAIYILEESMKIGEGVSLRLQDYGKNWALTRDELL